MILTRILSCFSATTGFEIDEIKLTFTWKMKILDKYETLHCHTFIHEKQC